MNILVAGGTGFIGRPLCRELVDRGHDVTAASRSPSPEGLPAAVTTASLDVTDSGLTAAVAGHDAVVNLVALPAHRESPGRSHREVHRDGTAHLVAAAEHADVDRFVQASALGVDADVDTAYFRAKRQAETVVRESALDWTAVRPSVVFGDGCAFLPFLERVTPPVVAPLPGGGRTRLQPMWVGDLAPILADCVEDGDHAARTYELGGPEALTLAETVQLVCGPRLVLRVPMSVAAVGFTIAEHLPGIPVGRDQYRALTHDNVTTNADLAAFGYSAPELTGLATYLNAE